MTDAQFRVTVASDDATPVVVASGDIDLANVADFSDAMANATNGSTALTVDLTEVKDIFIYGNHSPTMFPAYAHATIGGKLATSVITDTGWLRKPTTSTLTCGSRM